MERYCCIRDAYDRLCDRLQEEDEDEDVEQILRCFLEIEAYIGLRMYEYGAYFEGNKR